MFLSLLIHRRLPRAMSASFVSIAASLTPPGDDYSTQHRLKHVRKEGQKAIIAMVSNPARKRMKSKTSGICSSPGSISTFLADASKPQRHCRPWPCTPSDSALKMFALASKMFALFERPAHAWPRGLPCLRKGKGVPGEAAIAAVGKTGEAKRSGSWRSVHPGQNAPKPCTTHAINSRGRADPPTIELTWPVDCSIAAESC